MKAGSRGSPAEQKNKLNGSTDYADDTDVKSREQKEKIRVIYKICGKEMHGCCQHRYFTGV